VAVDELSVAVSLVESAAAELHRLQVGERVTHVHVRVGRDSGLAREALLFSFGLVAEGSALEGATLEIEETGTATDEGLAAELVALDVDDGDDRQPHAGDDQYD
jgi:Zn finger protein HypA/HybF involved in hydrogenase expression